MRTIYEIKNQKECYEFLREKIIHREPITVELIKKLHLNFESIHPFADGNGRVGRTLMNYFLMIHQHPPTIFYEEDKEVYYMALATFDKTEKIDGFRKFLEEQTIKTWAEKRRRTKNLELSN